MFMLIFIKGASAKVVRVGLRQITGIVKYTHGSSIEDGSTLSPDNADILIFLKKGLVFKKTDEI